MSATWAGVSGRSLCPCSSRKSFAVASSSSTASAAAASVEPATTGPWLASSTRVMPAGVAAHRLGQRHVARREVGHQRQRADAHHVVGRERRQQVVRDRGRRAPTPRPNASSAGGRPRRFAARSWYIARCRKLSLDGASPETSLPFQSSFDSRAGSSRPRLEPVGVSSQPSAQRALMLPVEPCGQAALEDRPAELADLLAQRGLLHGVTPAAPAPWRRNRRCRNCPT